MMDALPSTTLTADQFIAWSLEQPDRPRYELSNGKIFQMASERLRHAMAKHAAVRRLEEAIERLGLGCQAYPDGMAVRIDDATVFEPDAAVRCGQPLDGDTVVYADPVIVVEIASPSTKNVDLMTKFIGYFRLASIQHYLIIGPEEPCFVIHHRRMPGGDILSRVLKEGPLTLDPPGLTLDVASLFP